jgi:8-oxo-dGTP pyrophosphatase MutT (NUDIX family)
VPHLFYYLDFTVAVFVVFREKVLLVHHRALDRWLPLGGHIEPGEDPEQAALREVREESSLDIELLGTKPPVDFTDVKVLPAPAYVDVHPIKGEHKHLGLIYFGRASSEQVQLATREHTEIRWFSSQDIATLNISDSVRFYANTAIETVSGGPRQ